jgi:hypothetical protein
MLAASALGGGPSSQSLPGEWLWLVVVVNGLHDSNYAFSLTWRAVASLGCDLAATVKDSAKLTVAARGQLAGADSVRLPALVTDVLVQSRNQGNQALEEILREPRFKVARASN